MSLDVYGILELTLRNISLDKVSGFRLIRCARESNPAAESTRSALEEPLGMLKILRATLASRGRDPALVFQNPSTPSCGLFLIKPRYSSIWPRAVSATLELLSYEPKMRTFLAALLASVTMSTPLHSASFTNNSRISASWLLTAPSLIIHSVLKRGSNTAANTRCF